MKTHFRGGNNPPLLGWFYDYNNPPICKRVSRGYKLTIEVEKVTCQECIKWLVKNTDVLERYLVFYEGIRGRCILKKKKVREEKDETT